MNINWNKLLRLFPLALALCALPSFAAGPRWELGVGGNVGLVFPSGDYVSAVESRLSALEGSSVSLMPGLGGGAELFGGLWFSPHFGISLETLADLRYLSHDGQSASWNLFLPTLRAQVGADSALSLPAGMSLRFGPRAGAEFLPAGAWEGNSSGGISGIERKSADLASVGFIAGAKLSLGVPLPSRGTVLISLSGDYSFNSIVKAASWGGDLKGLDLRLGVSTLPLGGGSR